MNQWLNDQADAAAIPDHLRQRFIDDMRGTAAFASARLSMTVGDLWQASGASRAVRRIAARLDRRLR